MAIVYRNDPVRLFFRRIGMVALLVFILLVMAEVWDVFQKERESRMLRDEANVRLTDLQAQREHLRDEIATLKTARGKEEALREHYEYGKYGEGLIVIVEPPTPEPIQATSTFRQWVQKFLPFW
jgi:hypothetical protein